MKASFTKPLSIAVLCVMISASYAQVSLSIGVGIAPPVLPIYAQPVMPGDGYMWTPGYWSWDQDNNDYYWVPGTWVLAPYPGAMWTPGYWGYNNGQYAWSGGYWGMHIGYYGGINYGHGYTGAGYQGGYWNNGHFAYNRSVNNVGSARITNTYSARVNVVQNTRLSFNGGKNGVQMTASKNDQIINSMPHQTATPTQQQHETDSRTQPNQRLSVNHGAPKVAATPQPSSFSSEHVESAKEEPAAKVAHAAAPQHAVPHPAPQSQQPHPAQHQQSRPAPQQQSRAGPQESHDGAAHEEERK